MTSPNETLIVLAKCKRNGSTFGIRTEKSARNHWNCTWAFPMKESAAKREGYDKSLIKGTIDFDPEYPGCPYCGNQGLIVCNCGRVGCYDNKAKTYTCKWCGTTGTVGICEDLKIQAGMDA